MSAICFSPSVLVAFAEQPAQFRDGHRFGLMQL